MRLPSLPRLSTRPSPSMAVSVLALVVASTGTSYAAALVGSQDIRNESIRSVDVEDRTLKGRDVKNNTLGSNKVRNGALKARDFAPGVLTKGDTRWALVDATGAIIAQSGGFKVAAAYPTLTPAGADTTGMRANGNVYIDAQENLQNNGIVATIALQNTVDQNGDGVTNGRAAGENPEFSGEISAAMCQPGVVNCAPPGTQGTEYLVVSPRNSDGTVTTPTTRKRFYVIVTGDSDDFVAE